MLAAAADGAADQVGAATGRVGRVCCMIIGKGVRNGVSPGRAQGEGQVAMQVAAYGAQQYTSEHPQIGGRGDKSNKVRVTPGRCTRA